MRKLCVLLLFLCVLPLYAQETETTAPAPAPAGQEDALSQKVKAQILKNKKVKVNDLMVTNLDGTIQLQGVADLFGSRYYAEQNAKKVDGVKKVDNQIAVTTREVSDVDLTGTLTSKIDGHIQSTPFDYVGLRVHHGFVELFGEVRDMSLQRDAFEETVWTPGVRDVANKIELASISSGDERLRQTIYTTLKAQYPQYFAQRHPSVLILVRSAVVTLIGNVQSPVDVQKIANYVRNLNGVLNVVNQLQPY